MLLTAFFLITVAAQQVNANKYVTCDREKYKKIGCFNEQFTATEVTLINDRDTTSEHFKGHELIWREFAQSIHSLACRCFEAAKKGGYTYFAIRYWGICVAGKNTRKVKEMMQTGRGKSNNCANINFGDCQQHDGGTECAGRANAEYMYWVGSSAGDGDVNGGYSTWSEWSDCSLTCGSGVVSRERACDNPLPSGKGKDCVELGASTETKECKLADCPIDGAWTAWSQWDDCSKACGEGKSIRTRICSNPKPMFGGKPCPGLATEEKSCKKAECPIHGKWSEWSKPSDCSVTCGNGLITYTRKCDKPAPQHGGAECPGEDEKTQECSSVPCPVDGGYGLWSSFSECSKTCGAGSKSRNRTCNDPSPAHGGRDCQGKAEEVTSCKIMECPIHGEWSAWGSYGKCDEECGFGSQERSRTCTNPAPKYNGNPCTGAEKEDKDCKVKECPVDGNYSPWSSYTECSASCGEGSKQRSRTCTNPAPAHGGQDCSSHGADKETAKCKIMECPIDGGFTEWSSFTKCSKTCGVGSQSRTRSCTNPTPQHNGEECIGPVMEERDCKDKECPVDGHWAPWGSFKACSTSCGDGTQERSRTCTNPAPAHGGKDCEGKETDTTSCKIKECPIDGGWSDFGSFSSCSVTCGIGTQTKTRTCTMPIPQHGGDNCVGDSTEERQCKDADCPVDGGLSPWTTFTVCSRTCGKGSQQRTRSCTNPPPRFGGKDCSGDVKETRECKVIECPVDGGFSEWSSFSTCSKSCGLGEEQRTRTCTSPSPAHGGDECIGENQETRLCKLRECPVDGGLSPWTEYSSCSVSCGEGRQTRERACINPRPAHGGKACNGPFVASKKCNLKECPIDGAYSPWGSYSECSKSCGLGTQERKRTCTNPAPAHGGDECEGEASQLKTCKLRECAVDGGFSPWSAFSACSATCGEGYEERSRTCTNPSPLHGGKDCDGDRKETKSCKVKECPIDGGVTQWGNFGSCSKTCGVGTQTRVRTCTNPRPQHDGDDCTEELTDTRSCKVVDCPIDGGFTPWGEFGGCSETCGNGISTRHRSCTNPAPQYGGKKCSGATTNTKPCKIKECPVNGQWGSWSKFDECSASCGLGNQERKRTCSNPAPAHGGDNCVGDSTDIRTCKLIECPVDGDFTPWSKFGTCSEPCGDGTKTRTRSCTNPAPAHGGKACSGPTEDEDDCKIKECPVNGGFTDWSNFGECTKTCGEGKKTRTRSCTNPTPAHGGSACSGATTNVVACKVRECPVNGGFTKWSAFDKCSEDCGPGIVTRRRSCTSPSPAHGGKDCQGESFETKVCKIKECPVDGGFSKWSSFGPCSKSCGDGTKERTRSCTSPAPAHGGKACSGPTKDIDECKIKECPVDGGYTPWSSFSACSKTCGSGSQERKRSCTNPSPAHGGKACSGAAKESQECKDRECPIDGGFSQWSSYDDCTELCGGGSQERTRTCTNPKPQHGGKDCGDAISQTRTCNTHKCKVDGGYGEWSSYGPCSKTCSEGQQTRTRKCVNNRLDCSGPSTSKRACKQRECPVDGGLTPWSSYSACSKTCGSGTQERTRSCTNPAPAHGGKKCSGSLTQSRTCKEKECPINGGFTSWTKYGACSETCGNGVKTRSRSCTNPAPQHGGKDCSGAVVSSRTCMVKECPVNGNWGSWSKAGACSTSCGGGVSMRIRECNSPAPAHGGANCKGSTTYIKVCNTQHCPVDGGVSSWSSYSKCSKACGSGSQYRTRTCTNPIPAHGGKDCSEKLRQTRSCKIKECPIHGGFSKWSSFSSCSKTCGTGSQQRTRSCTNPRPQHGGRKCSGKTQEVRSCKVKECPVNGGFSAWSKFGECSKTCGVGYQSRARSCTNPRPAHGGADCKGARTQIRNCEVRKCAIHGNWGQWASYGGCTKSCGTGNQVRSRECNNPAPKYGGRSCAGSATSSRACNTFHCPVHGGFTSWSSFSKCSKTCGTGNHYRTRTCTNPKPAHGGNDCVGVKSQTKNCMIKHCPVNGNWGKFGAYGACNKKCGGGVQERYRACNNPAPKYGGNSCAGSNKAVRVCNTNPCPVDGKWASWGSFGKCSVTCGSGTKTRSRTCSKPAPAHGGKGCAGGSVHSVICTEKPCPVNGGWGQWSPYGFCTTSCGDGEQQRMRFCINPPPAHGGAYCSGPMVTTRKCKTRDCPIDGGFTPWSSYGACSKTCGIGSQSRTRSCTYPPPLNGGKACSGPTQEARTCEVRKCAVNGNWGGFGKYGPCSVSCGGGVQSRYRACTNPAPAHGGRGCSGSNKYVKACNTHACPVDGGFTQWSKFGACSKTCGNGIMTRTRTCTNPRPAHGGKGCVGGTSHAVTCRSRYCPVNGNWGKWGSFGGCNKHCGGGAQERYRACNNPAPAHGGKGCPGGNRYVRACNTQACPVNGNWGGWGRFGACNKPCGGGVQQRLRHCNHPAPAHGGKACAGGNTNVRACNTHKCPVNGNWGKWGGFGGCNKHCGGGAQVRYRACNNPAPAHGGKGCPGGNSYVRACNTHACPINGNWGHWGSFRACNKHCGGGAQERYRACNNPAPAHGGRGCAGSNRYVRACNTHACPVNGNWGHWGHFGGCNKHCGGGAQERYRSCNSPAPAHGGRGCPGSNRYVRACNTHSCAVNGNWGHWGHFGACNKHCGGGAQERYRACNNPAPAHGGSGCPGSNRYVRACNTHACPVNGGWSSWGGYGACSANCGGGLRTRYRYCNNPTPKNGGSACAGVNKSHAVCNTHKCTGWSAWGPWGNCLLPCAPTIRFRFRNCLAYPCPGGQNMVGVCNHLPRC